MSMRRMLGAVAPLALLITPAVASAQGATFGVTGGASFSNVSEIDVDGRTGFVAGAFVRMGLGSSLELQPEVLYHQKGADGLDADYIEIPVLFQFPFATQGAIQPFLAAGPFVAFNMSCDAEGFDCGDEIEGTEFGATFGGGVRLGALRRISAEVRYNLGMTEIDEGTDIKNQSWLLLAGFAF